ncbi:hypothetical protein FRC12_015477 [Ceratobasidium sp. 428]|nr:hypothetical protein FRC12_015477 [Ceratobasidium sp. 428]
MTLPKNTRCSRSVLPSAEPRSASAPPPLENLGHLPVKPRWTHNQQSKLLREATKSKYSITSGGPQEADDTKESFESVARAVIPKWFKQSEVAAGEEAQCQYNTLRGMYSDGRARFRQGDNELEYYIGADGPDDSTDKHAMDLWKQVCAECPLFPLMHELFYNHPKPAPSRCTPPHQPTDESSTNTKYIIFDRCHQRQIARLELEYGVELNMRELCGHRLNPIHIGSRKHYTAGIHMSSAKLTKSQSLCRALVLVVAV